MVVGSFLRTGRIEPSITLDRCLQQGLQPSKVNALLFENPSQALGCHFVQTEGIGDDTLKVEVRTPCPESVQDFCKVSAVLRHGQAVEQGTFWIGDRHPGVSNPNLFGPEKTLRSNLDELVEDLANWIPTLGLLGPGSPNAWNGGFSRCEDKDLPWGLFRQAMVVKGGPMTDGGWTDEGHGDFKLVGGHDARDRRRNCVEPPTDRNDPSILTEVVQRLW